MSKIKYNAPVVKGPGSTDERHEVSRYKSGGACFSNKKAMLYNTLVPEKTKVPTFLNLLEHNSKRRMRAAKAARRAKRNALPFRKEKVKSQAVKWTRRDIMLKNLLAPLEDTSYLYKGGPTAVKSKGAISLSQFVDNDYYSIIRLAKDKNLVKNFTRLSFETVLGQVQERKRVYLIPTYKQTTRFTYVKRLSHVKRICRITGQITLIANLEFMLHGFHHGNNWIQSNVLYINNSYMVLELEMTDSRGITQTTKTVLSDGQSVGLLGYRLHIEGGVNRVVPNDLIDKMSIKLAFKMRGAQFLSQITYYAGKYAEKLGYELVHSDLMVLTKILLGVQEEVLAIHSGLYESDEHFKEHAELLRLTRTRRTLPNFKRGVEKLGLMCESTAQYVKSVIKTVVNTTTYKKLSNYTTEDVRTIREKVVQHLRNFGKKAKMITKKVISKVKLKECKSVIKNDIVLEQSTNKLSEKQSKPVGKRDYERDLKNLEDLKEDEGITAFEELVNYSSDDDDLLETQESIVIKRKIKERESEVDRSTMNAFPNFEENEKTVVVSEAIKVALSKVSVSELNVLMEDHQEGDIFDNFQYLVSRLFKKATDVCNTPTKEQLQETEAVSSAFLDIDDPTLTDFQ